MATIKDIARELQLAVSTVSMALNNNPKINEETRKLVVAKANELGYVKNGFAVDLQRQKTNIIMLVVTDASRSYFSRLISHIQEYVAKAGYDLIIVPTKGSTKTAKRYISERRCDGAIIYTNQIDDAFIQQYAKPDFPIYVIGRYLEGDFIYCDSTTYDTNMGETAVEYLLAKGHKRIAFVRGSMNTLGSPRRFKGYINTMNKYQIPVNEELIFDAGDSTFEDGYRATLDIIPKLDCIDAIIYANDDIAIGGLKCLIEHGIKVPEQVSIIGSNNLNEGALLTPALTSIGYDHQKSASASVEVLVKAINHEKINRKDMIQNNVTNIEKVIERDTVANKK